ncbi:hypothetical protein TNIN_363221 [Trichonephila inaurata madagascariensis]|uniref:Uncharacterized protein n=1 Tax=Trichonephila inaurata madagascariensis TaxID=2747483 RepID=A0A8X7C0Q4_9ARAC|nr:hypothetical protein TNIN_246081 [Trichonephila inaurata madagascariensis]GFY64056.1 hypothetical protein TNIN_363221 [Trichonephila inaurata madagascariensis]
MPINAAFVASLRRAPSLRIATSLLELGSFSNIADALRRECRVTITLGDAALLRLSATSRSHQIFRHVPLNSFESFIDSTRRTAF